MNLAYKKLAFQSSTAAGLDASLAVDGDTGKSSCSLTEIEKGAWWSVELEELAEIHTVSYFLNFIVL